MGGLRAWLRERGRGRRGFVVVGSPLSDFVGPACAPHYADAAYKD